MEKLESPFLLIAEDIDGCASYYFHDNEESLREDAGERKNDGEAIIFAGEILSCRKIEI